MVTLIFETEARGFLSRSELHQPIEKCLQASEVVIEGRAASLGRKVAPVREFQGVDLSNGPPIAAFSGDSDETADVLDILGVPSGRPEVCAKSSQH